MIDTDGPQPNGKRVRAVFQFAIGDRVAKMLDGNGIRLSIDVMFESMVDASEWGLNGFSEAVLDEELLISRSKRSKFSL
jgi:hypothetical protein